VFFAGWLNLNPAGMSFFMWMGNVVGQAFDAAGTPLLDVALMRDDRTRWTTAHGCLGSPYACWLPTASIRHVLAFSDGLDELLPRLSTATHQQDEATLIEQLRVNEYRDDATLLSIWLPATAMVGPVPATKATRKSTSPTIQGYMPGQSPTPIPMLAEHSARSHTQGEPRRRLRQIELIGAAGATGLVLLALTALSYFLFRPDPGMLYVLKLELVHGANVAWSPDGKVLACPTSDNQVALWNAEQNTFQYLPARQTPTQNLAWSPDGQYLAAGTGSTIVIWKVATRQKIGTLIGHKGDITSLAWKPGTSELASSAEDHTIRVWDFSSAGNINTLQISGANVTSLSWGLGSDNLIFATPPNTVTVWRDVSEDNSTEVAYNGLTTINAVAGHPKDQQRLAIADAKGSIVLWNASKRKADDELKYDQNGLNDVAWAPSGTALAAASDNGMVLVWLPVQGSTNPYLLKSGASRILHVAWSPSGQRLAAVAADNKVRVWDLNR
jgi:hypothetical protein